MNHDKVKFGEETKVTRLFRIGSYALYIVWLMAMSGCATALPKHANFERVSPWDIDPKWIYSRSTSALTGEYLGRTDYFDCSEKNESCTWAGTFKASWYKELPKK